MIHNPIGMIRNPILLNNFELELQPEPPPREQFIVWNITEKKRTQNPSQGRNTDWHDFFKKTNVLLLHFDFLLLLLVFIIFKFLMFFFSFLISSLVEPCNNIALAPILLSYIVRLLRKHLCPSPTVYLYQSPYTQFHIFPPSNFYSFPLPQTLLILLFSYKLWKL